MRNSVRSPRAEEYQPLNSARSLGGGSPDFAVSFEDMCVFSRTGGERQRLVGHATGCVRSGQLFSIVGPPRQAEMMLHALRGMYPAPASGVAPGDGLQVAGTVTWNGQIPSDVDPRVLAYIDLSNGATAPVPPWQCPWEMLLVTIRVRVTFLSSAEQSAMVDQVLDMLLLSERGATPFGELSIVEQRLVLIARAIVGCSGIVFVHNPVDGLAPMEARSLLSGLKHLASAHGYAITIALPGAIPQGCLALLPDIMALAVDGRVAYQGPAERAAHMLAKAGLARAPDQSSADLVVHGVRALTPAQIDALVVANADGDTCRAARRAAAEVRTGAAGTLPALVARGAMPETDRGDLRWLVALIEAELHLVTQNPAALRHLVVYPLLLAAALALLFPFEAGEPARVALLAALLALSTADALAPLAPRFSTLLQGGSIGEERGWGGALERRVMWEDVRAGRVSLPVHTLSVTLGEGLFRRAPGALAVGGGAYLFCGWRFDAASPLAEAMLVAVVGSWAISVPPLVFSVIMVGAAPRLAGSSVWNVPMLSLCRIAGLALLALLFYVGGFPLAPASIPAYLVWLRSVSPYAFVWDAMAGTQFPGAAAEMGFPLSGGGLSSTGALAQMLLLIALSFLFIVLALLLSPGPPSSAPAGPSDGIATYLYVRVLAAVDMAVEATNMLLGRDQAYRGMTPNQRSTTDPMRSAASKPPPMPPFLTGDRESGAGHGQYV